MGGAPLEFPMRTAKYGRSRVSSAISVCGDQNWFLDSGGSSVG